jgi:hypothetical protein
MDTDITQPTLSPVGTVWVVTELIVWVHWWPPLDAIQSYILRIYLGPTPFQSLSLLTTVNWGATEQAETLVKYSRAVRYIQSGLGIDSYLLI